ncbi:MAG TPA: hypothetical protein ENJ12_00675 [Thiolapillus brandeum]|uniref:Uncharacterized protein n=1 Tax=Thiolapillus brandeum TaxID=1076588 RepID=A0A831RUU2_9GAMM|nr:hypothetical protein [Thiolapillus brandeum]
MVLPLKDLVQSVSVSECFVQERNKNRREITRKAGWLRFLCRIFQGLIQISSLLAWLLLNTPGGAAWSPIQQVT